MQPFPKTPHKVVTITINEDGTQTFLKTDSADIFLEQGETITRRASHVEPAEFIERVLFTLLRSLFADTSAVAAWTRTWNTLWRVNTKPVGGPILCWKHVHPPTIGTCVADDPVYWNNRQEAIEAEVAFLNEWFVRR